MLITSTSLFYLPFQTEKANAAVTDWQRGGSIYPTWTGDFDTDSFRQSLRNLKADGANYVALIVPVYQANLNSSDIFAGGDTPTDASLISAINYAHSIGLHVTLKPHLGPQTGEWRANISASNRDAWFTNYSAMLNHLGDIGNQTGVEGMTVGTELINMATFTSNPDNTQRWQTMINSLRTHFHGFLTYSANWGGSDFAEEVPHIGFWSSLDYIGISAYYPLAQGQSNPSVSALTGSWDFWNNNKISALHNQYGKPVLFTEIGYRSVNDAHSQPWDPNAGSGYNGTEQANDYEALFQYWNNQSWMSGVYLWNWNSNPNNGGQGNTDYTPQLKPAEQVMSQWWQNGNNNPVTSTSTTGTGGTGTTTGSTGNTGGTTGATNTSFSITGSISPTSLAPNQAGTITALTSSKGTVTNAIVDLEVYDQSNNKIAQKFFEGQSLNQTPLSLEWQWTPSSTGTYTIKGGIFSSDWSTNYYWNDSITTVAVSNNPTTGTGNTGGTGTTTPPTNPPPNNPPPNNPPSGPVDTNIWWPADGATISGVQPFKAMLTNESTDMYQMFWQVDGGQLNQMFNSSTDYPHKEAQVDLSGWNWSSNGQYNINFISKDNSGNILSQKSVNITVTH